MITALAQFAYDNIIVDENHLLDFNAELTALLSSNATLIIDTQTFTTTKLPILNGHNGTGIIFLTLSSTASNTVSLQYINEQLKNGKKNYVFYSEQSTLYNMILEMCDNIIAYEVDTRVNRTGDTCYFPSDRSHIRASKFVSERSDQMFQGLLPYRRCTYKRKP